jgi:hypothetical protein
MTGIISKMSIKCLYQQKAPSATDTDFLLIIFISNYNNSTWYTTRTQAKPSLYTFQNIIMKAYTRQDTKLLHGTHKIWDEAVGWGEPGWMQQQRKQDCKWHNPWHTTHTLPRCSLLWKCHPIPQCMNKCNFIATHQESKAFPADVHDTHRKSVNFCKFLLYNIKYKSNKKCSKYEQSFIYACCT